MDIKKRHEDLILVKRYSPAEYPKYDNFVLRLRPIKKDGTPAKQPETLGDAVLITNIVSYAEIID